MYAFRKPITAATYSNELVFGFHYKSFLIILQVLGYLCSKWVGISFISSMEKKSRLALLIGLMFVSYLALFLFAITPCPYNLIWIFFNGFPLGFIWGIVFSYLEGRRNTDILACFLSISFVIGSGLVKTIGLWLIQKFGVSEFWMPFGVASLFFPLLIVSAYVLDQMPNPSKKDKLYRSERPKMNGEDRLYVWEQFKWGLVPILFVSMILTLNRDIKDNFLVEIFNSFDISDDLTIFMRIEFYVSLILIFILSMFFFIESNPIAFKLIHVLIFVGILFSWISVYFIEKSSFNVIYFFMLHSIGLYLAYILLQSIYFERFLAYFKVKANVGYLIYMADFVGYLASCAIIVYKEFFYFSSSWIHFFIQMNYLSLFLGLIFISLSFYFFFFNKRNYG